MQSEPVRRLADVPRAAEPTPPVREQPVGEPLDDRSVPDAELVRLAQAGDQMAMERLLNRYKALVRARSTEFFMAGADREDVIQEGMIGLFKAIRTYQEGHRTPFAAFAVACVQSQIMDAVRRASRLKHGPLNQSVSLQAMNNSDQESGQSLLDVFIDASRADPEQEVMSKEAAAAVQSFLKQELTPLELKSVLLLMMGKSYQQIADSLGVGAKSVDNALRRARRKFAAKYSGLKS